MSAAEQLNVILTGCGLPALETEPATRFEQYLALYMKWNRRTNLSSIRDEEGVLRRHFAESIAAALTVPRGTRTLLDFGSGAGFPGLPIALCRPEIAVTLAESQSKKAGFLREVVRTLGLPVEVFGGRAETLSRRFDCVTLRAVDDMARAVIDAAALSSRHLLILTTEEDAPRWSAMVEGFDWRQQTMPTGSTQLLFGERSANTM